MTQLKLADSPAQGQRFDRVIAAQPAYVVLCTRRAALARAIQAQLSVTTFVVDLTRGDWLRSFGEFSLSLDRATVLVDLAPDPDEGVELCRMLRQKFETSVLAAMLCCAKPATRQHVTALLDAGVRFITDATADLEELGAELGEVVSGQRSLHVRLATELQAVTVDLSRDMSASILDLTGPMRRLLTLLASGMSDHELASALTLSQSSVRRRIEDLKVAAGARNRVELAAWAGAHGLYDTGARSAELASGGTWGEAVPLHG
jgi:DNA-binding NarL/FixJ family response regulator